MNQKKGRNHKIRLLHLVHNLGMGGAEIALLHYIKALGMDGYDHYVYCFGGDGPARERIESADIPVIMGKKRASIKQPIKFVISLISLLRDLLILISSRRIQVIQSHSGEANQLGVAVGKLSRVPAFPTIHSTMAFIDKRSRRDLRIYLIKAVNGLIYRLADRVIAVSEEIQEIVYKTYGLEDSKVLVLKNGIIFENGVSKSEDLNGEFPHSENKLKVIAVGRLVPLKGFDILIKAVAEVVKQGIKDLLVIVVGDGEERLRLEKLILDLKLDSYVKLLGLRHDAIALMKASDLFVMPSHYEGLSIAMIEAMACGLPIIASDAPGLRNYIKNDQNGLLFPVADQKALAKCILHLANDKKLRIRLSHEARKSFKKKFDMHNNVKSLDKLFREFAGIN